MVSREEIINLYVVDKVSPDDIAKIYGVSGRTVRNWLHKYGVELLGPSHLRTGKVATWNIGIKKSDETKNKLSVSLRGKSAWNKGYGDWVLFECPVCNRDVKCRPYRNHRYCSKTCMGKAGGETHFNFKGKESRGTQTRRNWKQYKEFKKAVHTRDNGKCCICGDCGQIAHHLESWSKNPALRFCVNNAITVCGNCHRDIHRLCGQRNYTFEKFKKAYVCVATNTWKRVAIATW